MAIAIRYLSRTGNTKKLAEAISEALGVPAETVEVPLAEPVDTLFLGSAVYAAGVDEKIKEFIAALDPDRVRNVVNISTVALLPSTYGQVAKLLAARNIRLDPREFHCRGKFAVLHSGRPSQKDLEDVRTFAKEVAGQ